MPAERTPPLLAAADRLSAELRSLAFGAPVTHVYDPLTYARANHAAYLERFGAGPKHVVFLGMNPGPFGMAQTGIPFGDIPSVRDWLAIDEPLGPLPAEHPKRRIEGLACTRVEVSGSRLWGGARARFGTPERFFSRYFVANYCPLVFMEASGRNFTPDKLPAVEREPLFAACDRHLRELVGALSPRFVVGVGAFAADRATTALAGMTPAVGKILHPSPASPAANRDWLGQATAQLRALGACGEAEDC